MIASAQLEAVDHGQHRRQEGGLETVADLHALTHQAGVVDEDGSPLAQRSRQLAILTAHRPAAMVGQHAGSEHPVPGHHGHDDPGAQAHRPQRSRCSASRPIRVGEPVSVVPHDLFTGPQRPTQTVGRPEIAGVAADALRRVSSPARTAHATGREAPDASSRRKLQMSTNPGTVIVAT